jgi:chemotaxis protein MotB
MRKKRGESCENLERWLLTYADMITLLMAFFIMMYSMSVLNISRFREAAFSIRSGFGGLVAGQGRSILNATGTFAMAPSPIQGDTAGVPWRVTKPLVKYIEKIGKDQNAAAIGEDYRGIVISLSSDKLLFEPGSAKLRRDARHVLDRIARTLAKIDNMVQVEGHTCDLPPRGGEFASNWELSTARATNVLRYLVGPNRLDPWRFSAAGYGSVRPKVANNSMANRRQNRRVEIVILRPESQLAYVSQELPRRIGDPTRAEIRRRLEK